MVAVTDHVSQTLTTHPLVYLSPARFKFRLKRNSVRILGNETSGKGKQPKFILGKNDKVFLSVPIFYSITVKISQLQVICEDTGKCGGQASFFKGG